MQIKCLKENLCVFDVLSICCKSAFVTIFSSNHQTVTKRFVLSNYFKIFDPLGILSPVIIQPIIYHIAEDVATKVRLGRTGNRGFERRLAKVYRQSQIFT